MFARRTELAHDLEKLQGKTVRVDQASAADAFTQILSRHDGKPLRGATRSRC